MRVEEMVEGGTVGGGECDGRESVVGARVGDVPSPHQRLEQFDRRRRSRCITLAHITTIAQTSSVINYLGLYYAAFALPRLGLAEIPANSSCMRMRAEKSSSICLASSMVHIWWATAVAGMGTTSSWASRRTSPKSFHIRRRAKLTV